MNGSLKGKGDEKKKVVKKRKPKPVKVLTEREAEEKWLREVDGDDDAASGQSSPTSCDELTSPGSETGSASASEEGESPASSIGGEGDGVAVAVIEKEDGKMVVEEEKMESKAAVKSVPEKTDEEDDDSAEKENEITLEEGKKVEESATRAKPERQAETMPETPIEAS